MCERDPEHFAQLGARGVVGRAELQAVGSAIVARNHAMRVDEFHDAHSFLERARRFLFKDEIRHNLLLSATLTLSKTSTRKILFLSADQGAALRAPNNRWILCADHLETASALAEKVQDSRSVILPTEFAHLFAGHGTEQNFMTLKRLSKLEPSAGLLRPAQTKDLKQVTTWSQQFALEQNLDESPKEAAESIQKYLDNKQLFVWENAQRLTAMAVVGGLTPKSGRLSMVYTDPAAREKGYASTLVHRLSHRLLQDGRTPVLFADAANATTKHVYEKLGFKILTSFTELKTRGFKTLESTAQESQSRDSDLKPKVASR